MKNNLEIPCKGFWNMCVCDVCRKRDAELERELDSGNKSAAAGAIAEFFATVKKGDS